MAETIIFALTLLTKTVISSPTMACANFKDFYLGLETDDRDRFAAAASTTVGYILTHLIYARKVPRRGLFDRLVAACNTFGGPTRPQLLAFFYQQDGAVTPPHLRRATDARPTSGDPDANC